MPFASRDLFEYELELIQQTGNAAVLPASDKGLEPLHAIYRRDVCLPAIRAALQAGNLRLTEWLIGLDVQAIPPEAAARLDPQGWAFWNLNTPEDLRLAEEVLERKKNRS
jgi:molybdopterin-guanine dinucleotide biosynthesis protein A